MEKNVNPQSFFMKFLGLDSYNCAVTLKALWIDTVPWKWENKRFCSSHSFKKNL